MINEKTTGPRDPSVTDEERACAKTLADRGNLMLLDAIRETDEDFADALARETTPTPPPRSEQGYPVDSVIDPGCVCCGANDQPRLDGGRTCLDAVACVKRRGERDADLRALAELRAMGPARLLKHLRALHTEWESPTAAPLACDELMATLIAIWGPVGAVRS